MIADNARSCESSQNNIFLMPNQVSHSTNFFTTVPVLSPRHIGIDPMILHVSARNKVYTHIKQFLLKERKLREELKGSRVHHLILFRKLFSSHNAYPDGVHAAAWPLTISLNGERSPWPVSGGQLSSLKCVMTASKIMLAIGSCHSSG
jgi:hypothetical protein